MKPSVCRDVHYVSYGTPIKTDGSQAFTSTCRAAKITEVFDDYRVRLVVFNPDGLFFNTATLDDSGERGGSWHWPERVE